MLRRQLRVIILTFLFILSIFVPVSAENGNSPKDVILSWTGGTDTTVTVTWHADNSADAGVVLYGTNPTLSGAAIINAVSAAQTSGIVLGDTVWQATITGLEPNTRYYYAAENGGTDSGISTFMTGEADTTAFSFLYMGDIHMGVGSADAWGQLLKGAYQRNPAIAFGIFGGDIVDSGINANQWNNLLSQSSAVFAQIPLMTTNGNHECNFPDGKPKLYLDLFALPQNGPEGFKEEFYSYDYGTCHITVLNSWVFSGEQKLSDTAYKKINNWLLADLASSRAKWKIIVMHHPVYEVASDKVSDAVRKNWEPLFEKGGVSLVLCGHQHVYSRSYPMKAGQIDYTDGITTIMGNASQKFYSSADETYQARTEYNLSSYQTVQIDGDTMTVQSFDNSGKELDYFTLEPRKTAGMGTVYSDIAEGSWYAAAVNYTAERGLMVGTSEDKFSPDMPVTRSMAAAFLYRLAGSPGAGSETGLRVAASHGTAGAFSDVPADAWYAAAASWLSTNGILTGTGGGRFSPDDQITREQFTTMLFRLIQYKKINIYESGALTAFSDAPHASAWAEDSLRWAVGAGLLGGTDTGLLHPGGVATRAQCAKMLMKFCLSYAL